jgi:hypothetical protein
MPQINNKKNKMKINFKNNNNSKVQVLFKNPITKDILYAFDSISEASKYLHISYKILQRHFNINPVQIYGALGCAFGLATSRLPGLPGFAWFYKSCE